jgi:D-3-phosphoglycerate dehydrogenase
MITPANATDWKGRGGMSKKIVLVVDGISEKTKEISRQAIDPSAEVIFSDYDPVINEKYVADAQVFITSTKGVPPEMLKKAVNCLYIQKYGSGTNNIAVKEASARKIPVGAVMGGNARSVAEYALTLALAVYKQTVRGHNALVQEGLWLKTVLRDQNYELSKKKVGIVGFGNIGKNLRQVLRGFECDVRYYDVYRLSEEQERSQEVTFMELDDIMRDCDLISLHCPLLPETKGMIDEHRIGLMKPTGVLVNCARGGVVNEAALYNALKERRILGAGVDTYEKEPMEKGHPFTTLDNVVLSPHNGGGTVEGIEAVVLRAAKNINSILADGTIASPEDLVNRADIGL